MFENKKIVVLGLARSGIAASKFLRKEVVMLLLMIEYLLMIRLFLMSLSL